MTITIAVNGNDASSNGGASVLDAVDQSGTRISQLCIDPDLQRLKKSLPLK
ncbi:MAG: hypothetical protein IIC85_03210 [Chloroflexi bacterium]|nr:hypothetical protein [Chloroflexota bacterium]